MNSLSWAIFGTGLEWRQGNKQVSAVDLANQVVKLFTGDLVETLEFHSKT